MFVMLTLLLASLTTSPALAQDLSGALTLAEEEPSDIYVIQDGDTLWDIAALNMGNPYYWARLWSINNYITNPHWIYPGDILRLSAPTAVTGEGVAVNPFSYTIGSEGARQVSISEGFVVEKGMKARGRLAHSPHTQQYLALDDLVRMCSLGIVPRLRIA